MSEGRITRHPAFILIAWAALVVATALAVALAIFVLTGPTDCPKYGGTRQPSRDFCSSPDLWTGLYAIPADVTFTEGTLGPNSRTFPIPRPEVLREPAVGLSVTLVPLLGVAALVSLLGLGVARFAARRSRATRQLIVAAASWTVIILGLTAYWLRAQIVGCRPTGCPREPRTIWPGLAVWVAGLALILVVAFAEGRIRRRA